MENIKVSMRYAKAIYPVVKQQADIKIFMQDLAIVVDSIKQSRDLRLLMNSPIVSSSKKVNVFQELFGNKIDPLTTSFMLLLISKGRERYINGIAHCVKLLYNKENNIVECQVVSAFELNEDIKSKVEHFLNDITQSNTIVNYTIDSTIIGGVLLKIDDKVYDISIKSRLKGLKNKLMK